MKLDLHPCKRFKRLCSESRDTLLSSRDESFFQRHREQCRTCESYYRQMNSSLRFMPGLSWNQEPSPFFDQRIVRTVRVSRGRESLRYWTPAIIGGFAASLVILAAVQAVTVSTSPLNSASGLARRDRAKEQMPVLLVNATENKSLRRLYDVPLGSEAKTSRFR